MKYIYITSARRNPEQNVKIDKITQLVEYLKQDSDKSPLPLYYISFTDIPKIGINPSNEYNTPMGIYTYPLRHVLKEKNGKYRLDIPFAGKRPYIQVLKLKTSANILYKQNYNASKYKKDCNTLQKMFSVRNENILNKLQSATLKDSRELSSETGHRETNIQRIWCLTQVYAKTFASGDRTVFWNKIFRKLGYEGVCDMGLGFIHPNEPYQCVFFSVKPFEHIDTLDNREMDDNPFAYDKYYNRALKLNINPKDFYNYVRINPSIARITGNNLFINFNKKYDKLRLINNIDGYNANITNSIKLNNLVLTNISCYNCEFTDCIFDKGCSVDNCKFTKCEIIKLSSVRDCQFDNCKVTGNTKFGNDKMSFSHGYTVDEIKSSPVVIFRNSIIEAGDYQGVRFIKCKIDKSKCKISETCSFEN